MNYDIYDKILAEYVTKEGKVNYQELKANRIYFDLFIAGLNKINNKEFKSFNEKDKLAFWINAYNALTLKVILDNYPIKKTTNKYPENSIRQIPGVWDKITFKVLNKEITLNHIEHEILRKEFNEPRMHIAINCASIGCPVIRGESFRGNKLDRQLDEQIRYMVADPMKIKLDKKNKILYVSSIFKWFGKDFIQFGLEKNILSNKKKNGVLNFLLKYFKNDDVKYILNNKLKIKYLKYDWSLNEKGDMPE